MNGVQRVEAECDKEEEIIKRKMDVLELRMQYETKKNALYEMQLKVSHACTHTHMYTLTLCLFLYTYKYACMHMETCTQPRVSRVPKSEMDTYEMQWKVRCACTNTHTHIHACIEPHNHATTCLKMGWKVRHACTKIHTYVHA
jgi:hypothetical protein